MTSIISKKIVAVLRTSTKKQNLDIQRKEIINYVSTNMPLYINNIDFIDIQQSAYHSIPNEIEELVCDLEYEKNTTVYDTIIFSDVDRLSRNVINGIEIINRIKNIVGQKVKVLFIREPSIDIYTIHGMNLLRNKLSYSELESDKIG